MFRVQCLFAILLLAGSVHAAETVAIDTAKAAQLRRMEPLTSEKIDVFVDAGQLTRAQADYIKNHINANGELSLPDAAVGRELPRRVPEPVRPSYTVASTRPADPYAELHYSLSTADRERLSKLINDFKYGNHSEIGHDLREFRPAVNELINNAYRDPADLPLKIKLWEEVAGPANPDAAIGLFETHRVLYDLARPVLIPYYKDVGGVIVHHHYFSSREFRNMIEDTEGLIAHCASAGAAIFLMDVYSQRYGEGEAPMRDKGRDRHRLVEACGGDPKDFDEDKASTWHSTLSQHERALIAERLIPWLRRDNSDRRKIARNGLMICLPGDHPDWDAPQHEWERWWDSRKADLLAIH